MRVLTFSVATVVFVVAMTAVGMQFTMHGDEKSAAASGPHMEIADRSFDLGDVPSTEVVERTIVFRNSGFEPLEVSIVKVRPAPDGECGCGVDGFEVRPQNVAPGEAGALVFRLKVPDGMAAMEDKMVAEIQTNDPASLSFKITLVFRMTG